MLDIDAIASMLGVEESSPKNSYIAVFVPSRTRDDEAIDHEHWRSAAVRLLSSLFGGATSVRAFGGWLDVEQGGEVKEEEISIVVSYISERDWNNNNAVQVRDFMYEMGRETKQGAVGLHVLGRYLEIGANQYEQ
ncbi:MAG: hypothetical protein COA73_11300 [Candidatus Hydrogenedentota bacterium]|nr:MAG: hypothetical protein COA73_11300 [Candidatus Hydrogenedentota bacterium]